MDLEQMLEGFEKKQDVLDFVNKLTLKMQNADKNASKYKTELDVIQKKLIESDIDVDNLENFKTQLSGKTELEKNLIKMQKQVEMLTKEKEIEKFEREKIQKEATNSKLINDFMPSLVSTFGKLKGELFAESYLNKGKIKVNENGESVLITDKGELTKDKAIEFLKSQYPDEVVGVKAGGTTKMTKTDFSNAGVSFDDMLKMKPEQLYKLEMGKQ